MVAEAQKIDFSLLRILVVEDNTSMMFIIEKMLEHIGFVSQNILKCNNGEKALSFFGKTKIHIVLTDWNMPIMNGPDLVRHIRRLNKDVPIIMETAKCTKAEVVFARELGVTSYLVKPFQTQSLKAKIEEVLSFSNESMV